MYPLNHLKATTHYNDALARNIHALTKQEGDAYAVRLYDNNGIELPIFICSHRGEHAQLKCWTVQAFINDGLSASARSAMYTAQTADTEIEPIAITVEIKSNYGNEAIYPVCHKAMAFARLADKKTLSRNDLIAIRALGFEIITKQTAL